MRQTFTEIFASKTQSEWCDIFDRLDACVTPVLSTNEAIDYDHNKIRQSFESVNEAAAGGPSHVPRAAPRLSVTPAGSDNISPDAGEHSVSVLTEFAGYSLEDCQRLLDSGVIDQSKMSKL